MGPKWRRTALGIILALAAVSRVPAADFALSEAELARLDKREVVIRASLEPGERRGTVRAAMLIDAPPDVVFELMIRCSDAMEYVPHLRLCRVRDRAADDSWLLVEYEIDFGWYAPRVRAIFHSDLVAGRSIAFRQSSGDFKANEGVWELEPVGQGAQTLLRYRVFIDPPGYVPNWLARTTFRRDLPQMLTGLRSRCETEQVTRAQAKANPR